MKIFSIKKCKDKKTIQILGIQIYKKTTDNFQTKRKYLYGLFSIISSLNVKTYYIINLPFCSIEKSFFKKKLYLRTPDIIKISDVKKELEKIYSSSSTDCDSIYYISVPTGEAYILSRILPEIFKKNHSQNPYMLIRASSSNIFDDYIPNINKKIFILKNDLLFRTYSKYCYKYKGKKIYIIFPTKHYLKQDIKILKDKTNSIHFTDCIYKFFNLNKKLINYSASNISISEEFNQKLKNINLNIKKFVIFCPEARTSSLYQNDFYVELEKELTKMGYDIFWNIRYKGNFTNLAGKTCNLTHMEIKNLAERSKGVIGIRSGLFDYLSTSNVDLFVIYTDFPFKGEKSGQYYPSSKALQGFSLKKLPLVNIEKIHEYDSEILDRAEIIKDIILNLSKKDLDY